MSHPLRQRATIAILVISCFTAGVIGTVRWRAMRTQTQQRTNVDRVLSITRSSDPSALPPEIAPVSPVPPAPRTQADDPAAAFSPVTVVRVQPPSSWSTNPKVLHMRTLLDVSRILEAETTLRASTTSDAITEYYAGVFDAWRGRREGATLHLRAALRDAKVAPYAQGLLDVYPFFDTFSDGQASFLDALVSRALLANGEVEIARDKLRFVTSTNAGYSDAWMLLGACELLLNHPDSAEEALRRTLPTSKADVYEWLGLSSAAQGHYTDAIAFFRQALTRGATPAWRLQERIAESQLASGDATTAAATYEQAVGRCAEDARCPLVDLTVRPVWINLEFLKAPERGLALAQRTLLRQPKSAMAENLVAWSLIRLHRLDEAEQHIEAALRLDSSLAAAHLNAGTIAWMQNDLVAATSSFARAAQLDPTGPVGAQARKNITTISSTPSTP